MVDMVLYDLAKVMAPKTTYMERVRCYVAFQFNSIFSRGKKLTHDNALLNKGRHVAMSSFHISHCPFFLKNLALK